MSEANPQGVEDCEPCAHGLCDSCDGQFGGECDCDHNAPVGGGAPDEPTDDDQPMRPATLLMAIYFPDMPDGVDPEQVADELVHILNEERIHNGATGDDLLSVSGIPPAQWATAQGLANLRASAAEGKELLAEIERLRAATGARP